MSLRFKDRPSEMFAPFVAHGVEWHCHSLWLTVMFWGYDLSIEPIDRLDNVVGPLFDDAQTWNGCKKLAWRIRRNVERDNNLEAQS